jgi:hypothetical protein
VPKAEKDLWISFSKVTGDETTYYLPLLHSVFESINAVYDRKVFSSIPGFLLVAFKERIDKPVKYPPELQGYFANGGKNNNPVIVEFTLKSNL